MRSIIWRRNLLNAMLVLLLLGGLAACTTQQFVKSSYVTLNESKDFYNLAMTSVAYLQKDGFINQGKRDEINKIARIYKASHNTAVIALKTYVATKKAADKDQFIAELATAASNWKYLSSLINAIKPGSVPETFSQ